MEKKLVSFTGRQIEFLEDTSKELQINMSEYIRRIVDKEIELKGKK